MVSNRPMRILAHDLRYGARMLRRNPGFTAIVVLVLALGIGANSAIFSVVNAVLLRPLPYQEPARLYQVQEVNPKGEATGVSPLDADAFAQSARALERVALSNWENATLTGPEGADNVYGAKASQEFFATLGVTPAIGRGFRADEFQAGAPGVVLLSDRLWRRRYHADPTVLGRALMVNGSARTVIGVLPSDFFYQQRYEYWAPWKITADQRASRDDFNHSPCLVRLKPGVELRQAQVEIEAVFRNIAAEDIRKGWRIQLVSVNDQILDRSRSSLLVLLGAVGFVLLIACTNVANLLLARAADRSREMSIRAALGAGRWRAFRQMLTESLLVAAVGGAMGLLTGWLCSKALLAWIPPRMSIPRLEQTRMDGAVFAFTCLLAIVTGILFGLIPAWQASRIDISEALKDGSRGAGSGTRTRWLRNGLIVAETALSVVLLAGAGLMLRSFTLMMSTDAGFRPERVFTMRVPPPVAVTDKAQQKLYYMRMVEEVRQVPGLHSAGVVIPLPLAGVENNGTFAIEGKPFPPGERPLVRLRVASSGFFRTMGVSLLRGRAFEDSDTAAAPPVAMVSSSFARRYFPDEEPVGKRISMGNKDWLTVVGVVGDLKAVDLSESARPEMYRPIQQFLFAPFATSIVIRTAAEDPSAVGGMVARRIREAFPDQPVLDVLPMPEVVSTSASQPRFYTALLAAFAAVALLLAAAGMYGVLSYTVSQRVREIGIRIALGASRSAIVGMVMGRALAVVSIGLVLGLGGAAGLTRLLQSQLYQVKATDPATYAGVCLLLAIVAALATWIPARRAMRVDPAVALRSE